MSLERLRAAHAAITEIMRHQSRAAAGTPGAGDPPIDRDELPVATCYVDEELPELVIGLDAEATGSRARHCQIIARIAAGLPVRVLYVRVVRDVGPARPPAKDRDARPLLGGVRMNGQGTVSLVIRQHTGAVRVITSSHVVGPGTGQPVGQAAASATYGAVIVNPPLADRRSDAAMTSITHRRVQGDPYKIWRSPDHVFTIRRFATSDELWPGATVWMQGAQTEHLQGGSIVRRNVTVADAHGALTDQVFATYSAQRGDSGAPIFCLTFKAGAVIYVGIHVGRVIGEGGEIAFYSPWEGVREDLELELLMNRDSLAS